MSDQETVNTFKILLIGNSSVGKSSFLLRFTDDEFLPQDEISATIGVDFKVKNVNIDDKDYKLTLWDTAGQERFRTLTSSYYRGAQGVILVYDVTKRDTFDFLEQWFVELETYCSNRDVIKMVVGNKIDKEEVKVVSTQEGLSFSESKDALFFECSAKTRLGINQAIEDMVKKIVSTPTLWKKQKPRPPVQLNSEMIDDPSASYNSCAC